MAKPKLTPQTPGEEIPEDGDQPTTTETAAETVAEEAPVVNAPSDDLPDQSEIDPAAIERPVLSKQGWVVPHKAI